MVSGHNSGHEGPWGCGYTHCVQVSRVSGIHTMIKRSVGWVSQFCQPAVLLFGSLWLLELLCCSRETIDISPLLLWGSAATILEETDFWMLTLFLSLLPSAVRSMGTELWCQHYYHISWGCGLNSGSWETASAGTVLSLSIPQSCLPSMAQCVHLPMYQCVGLSGMGLCWAEKPVLGYRCPTSCRLKERYKCVFLLCHDVLLFIFIR